ncbi:MAG: leucine-rich repeat domain-containing protein [Treponema sp.]
MSFDVKALGAFKKLGAVALITATIFFVACNQTGGGGNTGGGGGGGSFVKDGAVLTLSPDHLTIKIKAKTADDSAIQVEGCEETTLKSNEKTELHAKGTLVILKGKITGLYCSTNKLTALGVQGLTALETLDCYTNKLTALNVQGLTSLQGLACWDNQLTVLNVQGCTALQGLDCSQNQLTALNVQGLTDLQRLWCYINRLNAQAMTEILNALPHREADDNAIAMLYTEEKDAGEDNCKDLTQSESLKKALEGAKKRNWTLQKIDASGDFEDL